jgi:hypothetical protein
LQGALQVVAQEVPEEAAQRGAPAVAGRGRVGAAGLEVVEEGRHGVGVQVAQLQRGDVPVPCQEPEQGLGQLRRQPAVMMI